MTKRLFIIHGWEGSPNELFYQNIKAELESSYSFKVFPLKMPNPGEPKMEEWIPSLAKAVGTPDENTYFYGHSIGSQTILRYLQFLGKDSKVGGVIFTAGWVNLRLESLVGPEEEGSEDIAKPWLETSLNFKKIKSHCDKWVALFSDNDPYVPLTDKDIFKKELDAEIIVEHNKNHFPGADSDIVINKILELSK